MKMISSILDLLDPAGWLFKALAALVVAGAMWWAWVEFKEWVSAPAVVVALEEERAFTVPKIANLEATVAERDATIAERDGTIAERDATIASMNRVAELEKSKQLKAANEKTIQYNAVVKQNKELFAKFNAAMLSKSELDDRLRNITEQSSGSAASTSDSGFTKRLGAAYAQCESDVGGLLETASRTNERAAKAEAAVRALKN